MLRAVRIAFFVTLATGTAQPATADESFYYEQVTQRLAANGCAVCHAQDYRTPRVFEYDQLLPYLAMGTGPKSNVLIAKMANLRPLHKGQAAHPGGQRCATVDDEPCKTFQRWWEVEFGEVEASANMIGDKK